MQSTCSKQWEEAIATEFKQLKLSGTFEWVKDLPSGRKAIGSKIVFREKRDGNGKVTKYKARIVAKGFSQVPGQDFHFTYSSVAKFTTLRALISMATREDWELHHVDIVGAYLQGDLDEDIYMEVPEGIQEAGKAGGHWKLQKALYGLKQAGRQWKVKLDAAMHGLGLKKSQADDCLYVLREEGRTKLLVLVYVDDMTVASGNMAGIAKIKADLRKIFDITDLGVLGHILGIQINRDRTIRTTRLNQTAYIQELLRRHGMQDCAPVSTPLAIKEKLSTAQSPTNPTEKAAYADHAKDLNYAECLGGILYVTQTRPDIQHAVGICAQFTTNPGKPHLEALKRILRYLKGTAHFGLTLGNKGDQLDLVGWTDSDWAQDTDTRRSIGGFVFDVAGGSVSWSSKKQPTVALSTTEAEYMAASAATKEAIWLRILLEDLGFPQTEATTIRADN